jgi:acyl-CoA thioester hydrolase
MQGIEKFKLQLDIHVRWGDMDALQHVNNTVFLKWNEDARIHFFYKVLDKLENNDIAPILARQDCKYIYPVAFPDTVKVGVRASEILADRVILETKMWSHNNDRLVALVHSTIMPYNVAKRKKADMPQQWKDAFKS